MNPRLLLILVLCWWNSSILLGQAESLPDSLKALLHKGEQLYQEQQYSKATATFDTLLHKGRLSSPYIFAKVHFKLGILHDHFGMRSRALYYLFEGIELLETPQDELPSEGFFVKNEPHHKQWGLAYPNTAKRDAGANLLCNLYNRLGGTYYNNEEYSKAGEYWSTTLHLAKANKQVSLEFSALNNIGELHTRNGEDSIALELFLQARSLKPLIQDSFKLATVSSNLASTYLNLKQLDSALHFIDFSLNLAHHIGSEFIEVLQYLNYGSYYKQLEQTSKALHFYHQALALAIDSKQLPYQLESYQAISQLFEQSRQLDSALYYQKKWTKLYQQSIQYRKKKLALEIEAHYLISEKEQELVFLKEKTTIERQNATLKQGNQRLLIIGLSIIWGITLLVLRLRRNHNQRLKASLKQIDQQNKEKDTLLKEIHHRVKNNLQVITSLLSLQSYQIKDDTTRSLFHQSQYRINSMAMIHEMLYQSDKLSSINYSDYLGQLIDKLLSSIKGNQHQVQTNLALPKDLYLNIDTAIPLGLLINEIVTNALKYGIPKDEKGILSLKITPLKDDPKGEFRLEIGDNGTGFEETSHPKKTQSLGLRLIKKLARQLEGSIDRDYSQNGTHYVIYFREVIASS